AHQPSGSTAVTPPTSAPTAAAPSPSASPSAIPDEHSSEQNRCAPANQFQPAPAIDHEKSLQLLREARAAGAENRCAVNAFSQTAHQFPGANKPTAGDADE